MQAALRVTTRVLPGNRVEIVAPELIEGDSVEVFVVMPEAAAKSQPKAQKLGSIWELIQSLPPGPRSASTWEEIERSLQEDRASWDR